MDTDALRDDLCLLFEAGPLSRFHQHEDMLSFDLYARGRPFIVDAGITARTARRGETWSIDVALPSGRRDRISMDWALAEGPVLAEASARAAGRDA